MSITQVVAQLQAASDKLDQAHQKLMAVSKDAGEARQLVTSALEGASGDLAAQVGRLAESISQLAGAVPASKDQIQRTIAAVRSLGK